MVCPRLDHGHRSPTCTSPAFTGLASTYSISLQQFFVGTNPVIKGFILPEGCSRPAEDAVGLATGSTLEPSHRARQLDPRLQDHVHVIGHNCPSIQIVELAGYLAIMQSVDQHCRYPCISQPERRSSQAP